MDPTKTDSASSKSHDDIDVRIEKLKEEANALANGQMRSHVSEDCPADVQEEFWKHVIAFEQLPDVKPFDVLVENGVTLPAPEELEDAALTSKLWELINALALLRMYLDSTDHLSDRELYSRLWIDVLRQPVRFDPGGPGAWHIDLVTSGTDEETVLWLKYYADEDTRRDWATDFPDFPIPEVAELPFDRDRHLPQPHTDGKA